MNDPSPEQVQAILRERAIVLARPEIVAPVVESVQILVFRSGERRYGIAAADVLESIAISGVTPLPGTSKMHRGIINHRGVIYALVDIRPLFGEPVDLAGMPAQALLFLSPKAAVAVAVDAVESIAAFDAATIAPLTHSGESAPAAAVRGVTPEGVVVLDVWNLLADSRLIVDDRPVNG